MTAGRPTTLTEELTLKIRKLILIGKKPGEIHMELEIPEGTWDSWIYKDTEGLRTNITAWKAERFLGAAEDNMSGLLNSDKENIKADMTKFIFETAGKATYSKKSDTAIDITTKGKQFDGFLINFGNGTKTSELPTEAGGTL